MQIRILKQFLKSTELQIIEEIYDFSDLLLLYTYRRKEANFRNTVNKN